MVCSTHFAKGSPSAGPSRPPSRTVPLRAASNRRCSNNGLPLGPSWAGCARPCEPARKTKEEFRNDDPTDREILSAVDSHVVEPRIPLSARRTAVLGMAVHASCWGKLHDIGKVIGFFTEL